MESQQDIAKELREQGYRLTPQRIMILSAIENSDHHISAEEIYAQIVTKYPNVNISTVYRTLEALAELGLICKVHVEGGCRSYLVGRSSEHHHHLICSGCGRVVDFTDCDLGELEQGLSRETGFEVEGHLLEFYGLCPACRKRET